MGFSNRILDCFRAVVDKVSGPTVGTDLLDPLEEETRDVGGITVEPGTLHKVSDQISREELIKYLGEVDTPSKRSERRDQIKLFKGYKKPEEGRPNYDKEAFSYRMAEKKSRCAELVNQDIAYAKNATGQSLEGDINSAEQCDIADEALEANF